MKIPAAAAIVALSMVSVVLAWTSVHYYRQYLLHRGLALDDVVTDSKGRTAKKYFEIQVDSRNRERAVFLVDGKRVNREQLRELLAAHAKEWRVEVDPRFSTRGVFVAFLGEYDHLALKEIVDICHQPGVGIVWVNMITSAVY